MHYHSQCTATPNKEVCLNVALKTAENWWTIPLIRISRWYELKRFDLATKFFEKNIEFRTFLLWVLKFNWIIICISRPFYVTVLQVLVNICFRKIIISTIIQMCVLCQPCNCHPWIGRLGGWSFLKYSGLGRMQFTVVVGSQWHWNFQRIWSNLISVANSNNNEISVA